MSFYYLMELILEKSKFDLFTVYENEVMHIKYIS